MNVQRRKVEKIQGRKGEYISTVQRRKCRGKKVRKYRGEKVRKQSGRNSFLNLLTLMVIISCVSGDVGQVNSVVYTERNLIKLREKSADDFRKHENIYSRPSFRAAKLLYFFQKMTLKIFNCFAMLVMYDKNISLANIIFMQQHFRNVWLHLVFLLRAHVLSLLILGVF